MGVSNLTVVDNQHHPFIFSYSKIIRIFTHRYSSNHMNTEKNFYVSMSSEIKRCHCSYVFQQHGCSSYIQFLLYAGNFFCGHCSENGRKQRKYFLFFVTAQSVWRQLKSAKVFIFPVCCMCRRLLYYVQSHWVIPNFIIVADGY